MRWVLVVVLLLPAACRELGLIESPPHQQYQHRLERAGLLDAPLGIDWTTAAANALQNPVSITIPYRETGYFAAERPRAAGYQVAMRRGQRLVINLSRRTEDARIFVDLFLRADDGSEPKRIISADSAMTGLVVEIDRDGSYILRLQPELLRPARFTLTVLGGPSLGMPVDGAGNRDIKSGFGVDRDAGRRRHDGIDIFAPRGTPVLAAAPGRIVDVGENQLGGNVVWQWDPDHNQNLYYAHLDVQLARRGQKVEKGDTIGLVGNTGNARSTPPHLHFGIYPKGSRPIDPLPYVYRDGRRIDPIVGDTGALGALVRVSGSIMRVNAATGSRYRVELADGRPEFVAVARAKVVPDSVISSPRR